MSANFLVGSREVTESWPRAEQVSLFPLGPLPNIQQHNAVTSIAPPKAPPLLRNRRVKTKKKKIAQRKEQIKAPEKIQLNDEEIANLSVAQFETLVIRRLTEMVVYGTKIEEEVRAMQSEIKKNI